MPLRDVFVVTHTESIHHVKKIGGGWFDTSLTDKGLADAKRIALSLFDDIETRGIPIFSSDLKRCSEMAEIFQEVFSSTFKADPRLREQSCGVAGGKDKQWQNAHIKRVPEDGNRLDHRVFEGGESRREVGERITRFVEEELADIEGSAIVITHGFALTFVIAAWLRISVEHMDYCEFRSSPGGVTHLTEDQYFRNRTLLKLNDSSYIMSGA